MIRAQRILLKPTAEQRKLFAGAAGLSRFAWNWALALRKRHYAMFGKRKDYRRPSAFALMKHWNKIKDRRFPWVRGYSKYIAEESFKNLHQAYQTFFSGLKKGQRSGLPKFHQKGANESFQVVPCSHKPMTRKADRFNIPRIGFVKCQTELRWPNAKQVNGRIKLKAGRWWLTLSYDLPDLPKLPPDRPPCGIDLGCKTFATVSSHQEIVAEVAPPKPYAKTKRRLRRLQKVVSRRKKGSANRKKAILRLARQHERVANIRDNFLHQFTSRLVKRYGTIVLEDLSVKGLMAGMLAGTISDLGFGELRRQVEYKAEAVGTKVILAPRFYPSSKCCHECGEINETLTLKTREWTCPGCHTTHDRDHNAAFNLESLHNQLPASSGKVTPAETGSSSSTRKGRGGAGRRSRNVTRAHQ